MTLHVTVGVTPDMDAGGDDEDEVTGQGAAACAATIVLVAVILGGCVAAPRPASTHVATAAGRATPPVDGPWAAAGQRFPGSPCGSDPVKDASTLTPDDAELGQEIGREVGSLSEPFRNARWTALANDGTFARVLVCLQMRKSAADTWQEYVADLDLSKVAGHWRRGYGLLETEPLNAWRQREASIAAAGQIHAEVVRVEAKERPKETFGLGGRDYVATVRWSTDDHARHVVRYLFWFAVDGHTCLPYRSSYAPSTAPPRDVEQQLALATPLATDGTADFNAPSNAITVGPDPVDKAYRVDASLSNKEELQCTSVDNPHGQKLRILAVDGTYLTTPLDTPATPPPSAS